MRSESVEFISIDRRSSVTFDEQIKESIKALILDQTFYYQAALPTPQTLAKHLNVQLDLVKKAYQDLVEERYIKIHDDSSYSVAYFELTNYFFYRNVAIYDAIIALGLKPSIQCLEKKVVTLSDEKLKAMGFSSGEKLFYINRIYKGDDKPIIMLENYLPLSVFQNMHLKFVGNEPLNAYMEKEYNIRAKLSNRVTKAVNLSAKLAKALGERKHAASIQSTNRVYDLNDRLIDYGQSHTTSSYYFQALVTRDEMLSYYHPDENHLIT
ncbi:MAG: GntR family transcriptional regulator [Bacillota bacterium]|nr:MAG: GntR family transcriptional regulator [Bacillota bacterium]